MIPHPSSCLYSAAIKGGAAQGAQVLCELGHEPRAQGGKPSQQFASHALLQRVMWGGGVEGEDTKMLLPLEASLLQASSSSCGMLAPRIYKVQKGWEIT